MSRAYHIWTIGCQMNEADSLNLAARLEQLGYRPTGHARDADLIVVNTCVVRQQAEDKAYARLRHLREVKRRRPSATLAVMGCLVGTPPDPALSKQLPFVDVFLPPSDPSPLIEHLEERRDGSLRDAIQDGEMAAPPAEPTAAVSAYVPVVLGCSHACSFCVIPYRRGAERSRAKAEILEEIRRLAGQGVREVTLLGQIVDRYGLDLRDGSSLSCLLREAAAVDGILRVRFLTSHPSWLSDELLETVASSDRICPCIEVPCQSGNDEVLARMKRGYTVDDYRRVIARIRSAIPDVAIHSDVIVGFPGETGEQFMDTHRLLAGLQLDMLRTARYSERPQTLAARRYPDDVPPEEKERRWSLIEQLLSDTLERKHRALLGRRVEVLVEERARNGRWRGRTPQGQLVFFESEGDWKGRLADVRLTWTGPFSLIGEVGERR
jgi:tRNA-2-methylthio-N6-dimethylallyladenosine synthase